MDVKSDGIVSNQDALLIVNYLKRDGAANSVALGAPISYDVNRDGMVSNLDAQIIINYLNQQGAGSQSSQPGPAHKRQFRTKSPRQGLRPAQTATPGQIN